MKRVAALAVLQAGIVLAWAAYHERVRAHAPTFRVPLQPTDPYDVMRGRYFILNPLDRDVRTGTAGAHLSSDTVSRFLGTEPSYVGSLLVGFCAAGDVQRVCDLRRDEGAPPKDGRFWARARAGIAGDGSVGTGNGRPAQSPGYRLSLDFGLDRFFLPDKLELPAGEAEAGWEVEVSYRPGQNLLPRRLWFRGQPVGG